MLPNSFSSIQEVTEQNNKSHMIQNDDGRLLLLLLRIQTNQKTAMQNQNKSKTPVLLLEKTNQ